MSAGIQKTSKKLVVFILKIVIFHLIILLKPLLKSIQKVTKLILKFILSLCRFPYECSLPLPSTEKISSVNSVLKITDADYKDAFAFEKPHFQREYLMRVTATTKHRWFPRPKSRTREFKHDREFL